MPFRSTAAAGVFISGSGSGTARSRSPAPRLLSCVGALVLFSLGLGGLAGFSQSLAAEPAVPAVPAPSASAAPETSPAPATTESSPAPNQTPATTPSASPATAPEASPTPESKPASHVSIEIDVNRQRATLFRDGQKLAESPVSTGRPGHLTPTGQFAVIEKDLNHLSSLYGSIVSASGRTVKAGADAATAVPKGCHFKRAPMKFFLRFEGASGMHAGVLPGYPASHGCVRMPLAMAKLFYETAEIGSPVHVFGSIPERGPSAPSHHRTTRTQASQPSPAPTPTPKPTHRWFPFWGH